MEIKVFCERLSQAIKSCGYTQKEIANLLNISEGNITNWKKGSNLPSLDVFYKLCLILHESADYLLNINDI